MQGGGPNSLGLVPRRASVRQLRSMGEPDTETRARLSRGGEGFGARARRAVFRRDLLPWFKSRKVAEERDELERRELRWDQAGDGRRDDGRRPWLTVAGWGVLAALVLAGGVLWWRGDDGAGAAASVPAAGAAISPGEEMDAETNAVAQVVAAFLAAESLEEKLRWVVPTEEIESRMGGHYERRAWRPTQVHDFAAIAVTQRPERNFYTVIAVTTDGDRLSFVLPVTPDGPRIDWASHVGYCSTDWETFLETRPEEVQEMRVLIQVGRQRYAPYDDREEFLPVEISRPGSPQVLNAVLSKSATEGIAGMKGSLWYGKRVPVTVLMRFEAGQRDAEPPVARIEAFLCQGWFDGRDVEPLENEEAAPLIEGGFFE